MKALHELRCMSIFCFEQYQKTKNIDWKDRRKAIEAAIVELEDIENEAIYYVSYGQGQIAFKNIVEMENFRKTIKGDSTCWLEYSKIIEDK